MTWPTRLVAGPAVHDLGAPIPEHDPAVHVPHDDGVLRQIEQRRLFGEHGGLLFEGLGAFDEVGGARATSPSSMLAVVVVVVAVGLEAQQVPHPHAQLGAIDGLGEKVLGAGAQPEHPRRCDRRAP